MSVIRITDVWLKNGSVAEDIRHYLVHSDAVLDGTLSFMVGLHGEFSSELKVVLNDDHPHSDSVENDIHEMLIQARLDQVNNYMLKYLDWGFSSPAKTSKFRELLEQRKIK